MPNRFAHFFGANDLLPVALSHPARRARISGSIDVASAQVMLQMTVTETLVEMS